MISLRRRHVLLALASLPFAARARARARARAPSGAGVHPGTTLGRIGLGTWRVFDSGAGPEVLRAFEELGGGLVDTAPSYGNEAIVGAADLQRSFIATKVMALSRKDARAQVEASLRALRVDRVDLVQVHNLFHLDEALDVLEDLKADGKIGAIGVTHVNASGHDDLERVLRRRSIDFVQVNYSAGEREAERRVLPTARDRNVAVIVNRPFMGGDLLRLTSGRKPPAGFSSWSEALLRFAVSHPAVTYAIPATSRVEHLRANMQCALLPILTDQERDRIVRATLAV